MKKEHDLNLMSNDVQKQYANLRKSGKSRDAAITIIKRTYAEATEDEEDSLAVMIGLALSLCKKKELTREIANEICGMICDIRSGRNLDETMLQYISMIEPLLNDESLLGDDATYKQRMPYAPDWKVGDTFFHQISCPQAQKLGIGGWFILFYKVGEFVDEFFRHRQMMHVSLCPSITEFNDNVQINRIGFLRIMEHDGKWDYLVQLDFKNKKDELSYGLTKIGNFPNVKSPSDCTEEDPLTAMPLLGYLKKSDVYPFFEDQICRLYRRNRNLTY